MNRKFLILCAKIILSSLLLYISLKDVTFSEFKSGLKNWNVNLLLLGLTIGLSSTYLQGLRMKLLLGEETKISVLQCVKLSFVGYYYNLLLPISMGGEILKANYLGKEINNLGSSLTSIIQAKFMGLFALFMLGFLLGDLDNEKTFRYLMFACAFLSFLASITPVWWPKKLTPLIFKSRFPNVQNWLNGNDFDAKNWIYAFFCSVAIQFSGGVVNWLYFVGVGTDMTLSENFLYYPWLILTMMLPISFWNIGIKEAFSVNTYATIDGITMSKCIEFSLAANLLYLATSFAGFLVYLHMKKARQ